MHSTLEYCLDCGLPLEPYIWCAEISGIGDDELCWETYVEDEICHCEEFNDGMRPAKSSTQPRNAWTWCALNLSGHQF